MLNTVEENRTIPKKPGAAVYLIYSQLLKAPEQLWRQSLISAPVGGCVYDKLGLDDAVSTLLAPLVFVVCVNRTLRNERDRMHVRPVGLSWPGSTCQLW